MNKQVDNIVIENGKIDYCNFRGEETQMNRAGNRNFCLVIEDEDMAVSLQNDGWNVKFQESRERYILPVKVQFKYMPPKIWLVTGSKKTLLDEENVGIVDDIDVKSADMIIRPYSWEVGGKTGITAYIKTMYIVEEEDEFVKKYEYTDDEQF